MSYVLFLVLREDAFDDLPFILNSFIEYVYLISFPIIHFEIE
jgi:hypothetical protein